MQISAVYVKFRGPEPLNQAPILVRREEIALLREINRLDHAKAVQTSPKTDAGPRRRKMVEDSPLLNGVVADIGDRMLDAVPSAIVVEKPAKKDKSG